ncbi:MAG: SDR family NAD(P)-dependent oxidoreductase [Myxococcota bacterium]
MTDKVLTDISGASVAVTGTSRGIGRALVRALGKSGARVLVHARRSADVREVAVEARSAGAADVVPVSGDLRDDDLGERMARAAEDAWGGLDALVLNAAVLGPMRPLLDVSREELEAVLAVNVAAQLGLVRALVPPMIGRGRGLVAWASSGLGRFGLPGYTAYSASKHAVEGLMKVAAAEHGDRGVVHVSVDPGMVRTDMLRTARPGQDLSGHYAPGPTAEAYVRLLRDLGPEHNGASLSLSDWRRGGADSGNEDASAE